MDFSQGFAQVGATSADKLIPVATATCFNCGTWKWDSAHLPDAFFIPYILTGDYFYLEQSWFWAGFSAAYPVASTTVNYGRGAALDSGAVYMGQERSEAWGIRERAEAAWMSPDGLPETKLLRSWMDDVIAILDGVHNLKSSAYYQNPNWVWGNTVRATSTMETDSQRANPPLNQWWYGAPSFAGAGQGGYGVDGTQCKVAVSAFETAYLTYSLGRAKELGFATDALLKGVMGPWYVGTHDPCFNPYLIQCGRTCTVAQSTGSTTPR